MSGVVEFFMVDVFSEQPFMGNPLAVIAGGEALSDARMQQIANWTNLSETTFLLPPEHPQADYRVRIFTPVRELPFAGHPTLGTAHVWQVLGGKAREHNTIIQECAVGLVSLHVGDGHLSFAAPPCRREGPLSMDDHARICAALRLSPDAIATTAWVDNGPGWMAARLHSREAVLAVQPDWVAMKGLKIGIVGPWSAEDGREAQFEVRAFVGERPGYEDPVTGSLNASIAQWLIGSGMAPARYVAAQGTVLGRAGRVVIEARDGDVWVGGAVRTRAAGTLFPQED